MSFLSALMFWGVAVAASLLLIVSAFALGAISPDTRVETGIEVTLWTMLFVLTGCLGWLTHQAFRRFRM